jgi:hypothetical protein
MSESIAKSSDEVQCLMPATKDRQALKLFMLRSCSAMSMMRSICLARVLNFSWQSINDATLQKTFSAQSKTGNALLVYHSAT